MTDYFHPHAEPWRLEGSNGQAVVLLHGYTGSPSHWRPLGVDINQAGYTVVCPALAGHGTSLEDMQTTGKEDWLASAYEAFGDVMDHDRVHMAGLSMGGLLSLIVGADMNAASVTTINSPIEIHNWRVRFSTLLAPFKDFSYWEPEDPPDPEVGEYWVAYEGVPLSTNADLMALRKEALTAARRFRNPSLVIQSVTDETVKPISAKHIVRALGGPAQVVWLQQSKHVALLDRERDVILREMLGLFSAAGVKPVGA